MRPLKKRQLKAIALRADGNSWEQVARKLEISERTLRAWRHHPDWNSTLEEMQREWVNEYESKFKRMLPRVAHTHIKLLHSESEAIQMRAVDSAHNNYVRCIEKQEVRSEVDELKEMVRMLLDQLAQQKAG